MYAPSLLAALAWLLALLLAALAAAPSAGADTRDVLYVGNNWDGTADVVDPQTLVRLGRLNVVPDLRERLAEIEQDPVDHAFFLGIRNQVGEGHDQLVDDMFSSPDGRYLYVSRPSLKDVVAIDLATRGILWRFEVEGQRADHMGISPDGRRLAVSASTARKVHVIDPDDGRPVGHFASGDQPHENTYSADGSRIFHASIGAVFTPLDDPAFDHTKGERVFQVVDARTLEVLERIDMGGKLREAGYEGMSGAVRPMALSPDERRLYFQVSFHHGFVEYDLVEDRVLRVARLPLSEEAARKRRDEYLLDSAHHGLAMNPAGSKLCAAGTMSDYAAIVDRRTFAYRIIPGVAKPYWATNDGDGRLCFVSASGEDAVYAVDYATERQVARIPVGDHPQRMRMGRMRTDVLAGLAPVGTRPALQVTVSPRRVRVRRPARLRVAVTTRRDGRAVPVAGARVRLAGARATTGRRGRAILRKRFGFRRTGTYRVRATRAGYDAGVAEVRAVRRRG